MSQDERPRPQFEERAAEEELERIRRALEESRQRRKQASEAFDTFLRSFGPRSARDVRPVDARAGERPTDRRPEVTTAPPADVPAATASAPQPPTPAPAPPEPRADETPARARSPEPWIPEPSTPLTLIRDEGVLETLIPEPPAISGPASADASPADPVVPAGLRARPSGLRVRREYVVAAVAVFAVAAAFLLWRMTSSSEDAEGRLGQRAPAPAPASVPADTTPAPAAAPPAGFQVELTTLRLVWVRVIVDGERTIEREIPAGERLPLNAAETVVIRAGDAGALRVAIGGKDQGPLGPEGFPVTRTFSRPR